MSTRDYKLGDYVILKTPAEPILNGKRGRIVDRLPGERVMYIVSVIDDSINAQITVAVNEIEPVGLDPAFQAFRKKLNFDQSDNASIREDMEAVIPPKSPLVDVKFLEINSEHELTVFNEGFKQGYWAGYESALEHVNRVMSKHFGDNEQK